jgi:Outer membrane protein beta-barrel domain
MAFRKIIISVSFSLFCAALSAQYNTLSDWYVGPSAGTTMSSITLIPKMIDKQNITGKTAGISTRYISENNFGFQIDLNYSESGWKELKGRGLPYNYSRKLSFVEVPFLMHAYAKAKAVRFFINAGPKFSYLLSEREQILDIPDDVTMIQHGKLVEKPFQYGLLGGGGLELHLKRNVIGIEGRYCYNLSAIFNDAVGEDFQSSSLQVVSVHCFYYFQIGGYNKKR